MAGDDLELRNPHSVVAALREWTRADGALLVLDEVITFRSEFGGAQQSYDFTPDLTALGKAIGGGFPVGAIVGRAEVMDVMNPRAKRLLSSTPRGPGWFFDLVYCG